MEENLKVEGVATKRAVKQPKNKQIEDVSPKQAFRSAFFSGYNEYQVYVRTWDKVDKPKGVLLVIHGMVEHGLRYDDFAQYMNKNGYIVVAPDLRGHGKTAGAPENVCKYDGDIFADTVRDCVKLADALIQKYKLPLFVLGHSYGSFITQSFIQNYHKHRAAILSGSCCFKGDVQVALGKMVANLTRAFKGKDAKAKMIYNMTFANYGKTFAQNNWLTGDEKIYDAYCLDPYCGGVASAEFYRSFFGNLKKIYKPQMLNRIDKETPILITSGELDPVAGKRHKALDKLAPLYQEFGITNVTYKLWPNGRHEILNETFRQDVYDFILDFINKNNTPINTEKLEKE